MAVRDSYTASEWRTLEFALLWAFMGVAYVDGNVDEAEFGVLAKELAESLLYKDELTRNVLTSIAADLEGTMKDFFADGRNFLTGLQEAAAVLAAKAASESADDLKKTILAICARAAAASGTPGDEVSADENLAFGAVAAALGVKL